MSMIPKPAPCCLCGKLDAVEILIFKPEKMPGKRRITLYGVACNACNLAMGSVETGWDSMEAAVAAWGCRAEPELDPLTLEYWKRYHRVIIELTEGGQFRVSHPCSEPWLEKDPVIVSETLEKQILPAMRRTGLQILKGRDEQIPSRVK